MAGITANWSIGRIGGNDEASGLRKPKERGNEPNGPISPWKRRAMARIGTQWATREKALIWTMPFHGGTKKIVMQAQKVTHASHCRRQTLPNTRGRRIQHKNSKNSVGTKEDKLRRSWHFHKAQRHHLRVPNQYMGGGLSVKGSKRCGLAIGRKNIYFGVPT